jgi:RNA polymerase sigma-70 factor, ECF subfamily
VADPLPPAGELLDDAQLREALLACLGELDEPIRTALLLRFQQGFTFPEMAVICGEQAGTLQARVARALPVLRAAISRRTGRDV